MSMPCTATLSKHTWKTGLKAMVAYTLAIISMGLLPIVCLLLTLIYSIYLAVITVTTFARYILWSEDMCLSHLTSHLVRLRF